ncbi:hypothetical protein CBOM_02840 [Ceraceosorus bombacis]|uniref:Uncharacterized protein n=1 Tax=Ceraceosorus bombacis TaxID=401625 RepID=A0A0P1BGD7_9BASI|nr:hypothetical protein CBOM_02840 [Ceraceosorus bombacis]
MGALPVKDAFCGLSPRTIALLITPLLVMVTAVEAAWDAYVLAEFSDGLSTFRKIFAGLQVALLAILIVLFIAAYFVGVIPRKNKVVKFLAHIALLKGLALGLVGIIHIISVVKNKDEFHDDCVKKNTEDFCSELNAINIGFAVGLMLLQELLLFIDALALNSLAKQTEVVKESDGAYKYAQQSHPYSQPQYAGSYA